MERKDILFRYNKATMMLIDTPGIGATRASEEEKKNFQAILECISSYKEVGPIEILLKPETECLAGRKREATKEATCNHDDGTKNKNRRIE